MMLAVVAPAPDELLAANPATPYRYYRSRIGGARYDDWAVEQARKTMARAAGQLANRSGAIAWNRLAWDSQLFGFPAARIDLFAADSTSSACKLLEFAIDECDERRIRHMVVRIDAASLHLTRALNVTCFELIDGIQTFALELQGVTPDFPAGTRLAQASDANEVGTIARESFVHDRFHNDRALTPEIADRVNETWARNSVLGQAADAVLLADGSFVTCKIDHASKDALGIRFASIPLVATPAASRGKGAARLATQAALAWCRQQNVDIVEVGTQLANIPAARLYQSAGFRTTAASFTYRFVSNL